jgi:hypothetical protein
VCGGTALEMCLCECAVCAGRCWLSNCWCWCWCFGVCWFSCCSSGLFFCFIQISKKWTVFIFVVGVFLSTCWWSLPQNVYVATATSHHVIEFAPRNADSNAYQQYPAPRS